MATTPNSIVVPQAVSPATPVTFVNADGTTPKTLFTAGASGSVLTGISGTTDDTSDNDVQVFIRIGAVNFLVGTVRLVTLAGTDGAVVARNLLNVTDLPWLKLDAAGNPIWLLPAGAIVRVGPLAAVTAAKTLTLSANGEDF